MSGGYEGDVKIWSLEKMRRVGAIKTGPNKQIDGNMAYIASDKLVGVAFNSGFINFYHLISRSLVISVDTGLNLKIFGLQYLPKKKLVLANVSPTKTSVWSYNSTKKELIVHQSFDVKGSHSYCYLSDKNEDQILYTTTQDFIEVYNLNTRKYIKYDLRKWNVTTSNCIVPLDCGKLLIGDWHYSNFCILQ